VCIDYCLRGYFAMSETGKARLREYPIGGFAPFTLARDTTLAKLPDNVDFNTGARLGYAGTSLRHSKREV